MGWVRLNHMPNDYPMFGRGTRASSPAPSPSSRACWRAGLFFCLGLLVFDAQAGEAENADTEDEDGAENGVVIQSPGQETIDEYRINGKLYMIRITPQKGAPYYLVDADGDGDLETRSNELAPDFLIPSWVIFSW